MIRDLLLGLEDEYRSLVSSADALRAIVGTDTGASSFAPGWPGLIDRWLASGGIWQHLARWVVRFPLMREPALAKIWTNPVITGKLADTTWDELVAVAQLVQHHAQARRLRMVTLQGPLDPIASAALVLGVALRTVSAHRAAQRDAAPALLRLLPLGGCHELALLQVFRGLDALVDDGEATDAWWSAFAAIVLPAHQAPVVRPFGVELLTTHAARALTWIVRHAPQLLAPVEATAIRLRERRSSALAAAYLENVRSAVRKRLFDPFQRISRALSEHSSIEARRWFDRCAWCLARPDVIAALAAHLGDSGAPVDNLGLTLRGRPDRARLAVWWARGTHLHGRVHPFAASQYFRWVGAIEARWGAEAGDHWYEIGLRFATECDVRTAALFFRAGQEMQRLAAPPLPDSETRWLALVARDPRAIEVVFSDLWLRRGRRSALALDEQWVQARERLSIRHPAPAELASWCFRGQQTREVRRDLRIWTALAEDPPPERRVPLPIERTAEAVAVTTDARRTAERVLLATLQHGKTAVPDGAHPLVQRLADPQILAELATLREHRDRADPEHLEHLGAWPRRPRPGSVARLIGRADDTDVFAALRRSLERRQYRFPMLCAWLAQLESVPDRTPKLAAIRFEVDPRIDLRALFVGPETGSCTDGPRGSWRSYGLIHRLHRAGFSAFASSLSATTSRPWTFCSVQGFETQSKLGPTLLIDSIDVGGAVHGIRGGPELLADGLLALLRGWARMCGTRLALCCEFRSVIGRTVATAIVGASRPARARERFTIDAADLRRHRVTAFYSDAVLATHQRLLRVENVVVLPALDVWWLDLA